MRHVEHVMGTAFSFDLRTPVAPSVLEAQVRRLHEIDSTYSTYRPDSVISRLGRGELTVAECPPEVRDVLTRCDELRIATGGWFDIGASGSPDPSGLVKGWAVQQVSAALTAAGCTRHCVNGGGDVACAGGTTDEQWRVGIAHPSTAGAVAAVVLVTDGAVATSGVAERGFHVLDPHTGRPAEDLLSVSVRGPDLICADAYATAAVAMGRRALDWLPTLAGYDALVITADADVWTTTGWDTPA